MRKNALIFSAVLLCLPLRLEATPTDDAAAAAYLAALRNTPGALGPGGYLFQLAGTTLPQSGPLSPADIGFLYTLLFKSDGSKTSAYTQPVKSASALGPGVNYLNALRATPGALTDLATLTGRTPIPPTGRLFSSDQFDSLFFGLFDSKGNNLPAYTKPVEAAKSITPALTFLTTLRQTSGALPALQTVLGKSFTPSGPLSTEGEINFLYTFLFDAAGGQQLAYSNPVEAANAVVQSPRVLQALQSTPGAITALQNLVNKSVPISGEVSDPREIDILFGLLYKADKSRQKAMWLYPLEGAKALAQGDKVLQALRANPAGLSALNELTLKGLPPSGILDAQQMDNLLGLLYKGEDPITQLPVRQDALWANDATTKVPTEAVSALVQGNKLLKALRSDADALPALLKLVNKKISPTGLLPDTELDTLLGLLYREDKTRQAPLWANDPTQAVASLGQGVKLLTALSANAQALAALDYLVNKKLPPIGTILNAAQMDTLLGLLYKANDPQGNPVIQEAFWAENLTEAVSALVQGKKLLDALQSKAGAIDALNYLANKKLPYSGGGLKDVEMDTLLGLLYKGKDTQGNPIQQPAFWAENLTESVNALVQGKKVLDALQAEAGALDALNELVRKQLPRSGGNLSDVQIDTLLGLLYKSDETKQLAMWDDPAEAAKALAKGNEFLKALEKQPGALEALVQLIGKDLRNWDPTNILQLEKKMDDLLGLLYRSDPNKLGPARSHQESVWTDPTEAAAALDQGYKVWLLLKDNAGALKTLRELAKKDLPTKIPFDPKFAEKQMDDLLGLLYKGDKTRQQSLWGNPTEGVLALEKAGEFWHTLVDQKALGALASLTGVVLPDNLDKAFTEAQMDALLKLLYRNATTRQESIWNDPTSAAKALIQADTYLKLIRSNNALDLFYQFTGIRLTQTGPLADPSDSEQFQAIIEAFFEQLYTDNPKLCAGRIVSPAPNFACESLSYQNPALALDYLLKAAIVVEALRANQDNLDAVEYLMGQSLTRSGTLVTKGNLSDADYKRALRQASEFVFTLLFDAAGQLRSDFGSIESTRTNASTVATTIVKARNYLKVLRDSRKVIRDLNLLSGQGIPELETELLNPAQLQFIFNQLFDLNKKPTKAYETPDDAAEDIHRVRLFVDALRTVKDGGQSAMEALNFLTGKSFPLGIDQPLADPKDSKYDSQITDRMTTLFRFLYIEDPKNPNNIIKGRAYENPNDAALDVLAAARYLKALRATPGALDGILKISGITFPGSGELTESQIQFLFGLLYDTNGKPTRAYHDPFGAAQILADFELGQQAQNRGGKRWLGVGLLVAGIGVGVFWNPWIGAGIGLLGAYLTYAGAGLDKPKEQDLSSAAAAVTAVTERRVPAPVSGARLAPVEVAPTPVGPGRSGGASVGRAALPSGAQSLIEVISAEAGSHYLGTQSPAKAYQPLLQEGNTPNPQARQASFDQFRWLTQSQSGRASAVDRREALNHAAASNKNVGVLRPTDSR